MFSKLHDRVGTAGLVVAVVALVAALSGTAIAASGGLSGKQKKEVEKIAKSVSKPGKTGPTGPAGPGGPAGTKGDAGAAGGNGTAGTAGINGVSVTTSAANSSECEFGGVKLTSANGNSKVCNGEEGPPGPPGSPWPVGTLPKEATETGAYSIISDSGVGPHVGYAQTSISFNVPLAAQLASTDAIFVPEGGAVPAHCENSLHAGAASVSNPEASAGFLCVFEGGSLNFNKAELLILKPTGSTSEGAGVSGATLAQEPTGAGAYAEGTWAVTGSIAP